MAIQRITRKQIKTLRRQRLVMALAGAMVMPVVTPVSAAELPQFGTVVNGTASINSTGTQMTVTQTTKGAIINWGEFNIGAGYGVTFDQQFGASSVTLNRVIGFGYGYGANMSMIDGSLSANGSVFIINPAGVTFGAGSQVNVGGLVASTMDITDANFNNGVANGHYQFDPMTAVDSQTITVDSGGNITTTAAGTVALLGRQVINNGSIAAPGGSVLFGSAESVTLDFQGDGLTMLTITGPGIASPGGGPCPSLPCPVAAQPELINYGTITADGGQIVMRTAATASGTGGGIANIGTLQARSLVSRNGRVELTSDQGMVWLGYNSASAGAGIGTIDVSGQSGTSGGTVLVRAGDFQMFNDDITPSNPTNPSSVGSVINASGDLGGGVVDIQAANLAQIYSLSSILANGNNGNGGQISIVADTLTMGAGALFSANSNTGAGGGISLSSSNSLSLYGRLWARGGTAGGVVDTATTADSFDFRGLRVEAGSATAAGTWTLTVPNLTVINGTDAGELDAMMGGTYLQDAELNHALGNTTNVVLNTGSDIYFDDAQIVAASNIPMWLKVNAGGRIGGNGFSIGSLSAPLDMFFNSDSTGANAGLAGISFSNAALDSHGGNILLYGQSDASNGVASDETWGIRLEYVDIVTSGGDLLLRGDSTGSVIGYGDAGVSLNQTSIDAGDGVITLFGTGANSANGVYLLGGSQPVTAGAITITGTATGNATGVGSYGMGLLAAAGDITVAGTGGGSGVVWSAFSNSMVSSGGDIHVHGTGNVGDGANISGSLDSGGGDIDLYGSSTDGTGLRFNGGFSDDIASGGGSINLHGIGAAGGVALIGGGYGNNTIDSSGGALTINGNASASTAAGVTLDSINALIGSGDVAIYGANVNGYGVQFYNGGSVTTTTGDILISSVGQLVGLVVSGGDIATDSGDIDLRGRGTSVDADGLVIGQYANLTSNGGEISLSGEGVGGVGVHIDNFASVDAGNGIVTLRAANDGTSDAVVIAGNIHSSSGVNLRPGGVDLTGLAYDRTSDGILLGNGTGFALSDAELDFIDAPELVVGSSQHAGSIQVVDAIIHAGNLTLQNMAGSGGIDLQAGIDTGGYALSLLTSGTISQSASGAITAHSLLANAGGDVFLNVAGNDVSSTTLAGSAGGDFRFLDVNDLAIGAVAGVGFDALGGGVAAANATGITAGGNVLVQNQAGNLILNAGISGADIVLATAGALQNLGSANLNASGNWQVWANTWVGESRGGLSGGGSLPNLYGCVYLGACGVTISGGDNHFIYAQQPTLFITADGLTREYGLANPALTYSATGLILGDSLANVLVGGLTTSATSASNVGTYSIGSAFASPAGYQIQFTGAVLNITPALLVFTADPFVRFMGLPNPIFTGTITGFRNGDTAQSVFGSSVLWTSSANEFSAPGFYSIVGGVPTQNYVFAQAPSNAMALRVVTPQLPDVPIAIVSNTPNTYVYDRNLAGAPVCAVNASEESISSSTSGDMLANEWSKVRSRPNLTNCFDSERRSACGDF